MYSAFMPFLRSVSDAKNQTVSQLGGEVTRLAEVSRCISGAPFGRSGSRSEERALLCTVVRHARQKEERTMDDSLEHMRRLAQHSFFAF